MFSHDIKSVIPTIAPAELRRYPIEKMVTHRFPLEEAERAVRMVGGEIKGEEAIKVVIVPLGNVGAVEESDFSSE